MSSSVVAATRDLALTAAPTSDAPRGPCTGSSPDGQNPPVISMGAREPVDVDLNQPLHEALELLESDQHEAARRSAAAQLKQGEERGHAATQAEALTVLALHDNLVGCHRRALPSARRALKLLQAQNGGLDAPTEARVLGLLADAASGCGRHEEAVETALLAQRLAERLPDAALSVRIACQLGMVYAWAGSTEAAEAEFAAAAADAARLTEPSLALWAGAGLAFNELLRLFRERYYAGQMPDTALLRERLHACAALWDADAPPAMAGAPGMGRRLQRLGRCARALCQIWSGELESARRQGARPLMLEAGSPRADAWTRLLGHWLRAELDWSGRSMGSAQGAATRLLEAAAQAGFEPMEGLARMLRTQIHKAMGRFDLALDDERQMRRREQLLRAESLENRQRVVQAQLDVRYTRRHLQQLAERSRELERLSFEDALTGIANRRSFEHRLQRLLGRGAVLPQTLCVALIDVDDFKAINDLHSHGAGDAALRGIADVLRQSVRDYDVAARLGGDEFVVLFAHSTLDTARQVCERISERVSALRWDDWPALRASISIGVASARPGDTMDGLMQRADACMFRAKERNDGQSLQVESAW
ncbi:MAG: hypothetical protein RL223_1383 [Pseudomonadota bacterium]